MLALWITLAVLAGSIIVGGTTVVFLRARHRETLGTPARTAIASSPVPTPIALEVKAIGDQIERAMAEQRLQGETQRQFLTQKLDSVRQAVEMQRHQVDGLRGELRHEVTRRDTEMEEIRHQLAELRSGLALAEAPPTGLLAAPPSDPDAPTPSAQPSTDSEAPGLADDGLLPDSFFEVAAFEDGPSFQDVSFETPVFENEDPEDMPRLSFEDELAEGDAFAQVSLDPEPAIEDAPLLTIPLDAEPPSTPFAVRHHDAPETVEDEEATGDSFTWLSDAMEDDIVEHSDTFSDPVFDAANRDAPPPSRRTFEPEGGDPFGSFPLRETSPGSAIVEVDALDFESSAPFMTAAEASSLFEPWPTAGASTPETAEPAEPVAEAPGAPSPDATERDDESAEPSPLGNVSIDEPETAAETVPDYDDVDVAIAEREPLSMSQTTWIARPNRPEPTMIPPGHTSHLHDDDAYEEPVVAPMDDFFPPACQPAETPSASDASDWTEVSPPEADRPADADASSSAAEPHVTEAISETEFPVEADLPSPSYAGADDLTIISSVDETVQRRLYEAGVLTLDEIARWGRGDARHISAVVGLPEDTIMTQWVFEAQAALFNQFAQQASY